jgi:hypothetical protein
MGTGSSFPGVKRPESEADHSRPSSVEVKEWVELYLHSQYAFMAWCSIKAQGQLYFTLLYFTLVYRFIFDSVFTKELYIYEWFVSVSLLILTSCCKMATFSDLHVHSKGCIKVKLSPRLTKYHAMKTYWGNAPLILKLDTWWKSVS